MADDIHAKADHAPTLSELFLAFSQISLSGFGGVLPWARRTIVEERRWMTAREFNAVLGLCQVLPGPNVVNFSVVFGSRTHGWRGAVVAFLGLLAPASAIALVLAVLYRQFGDLGLLQRLLAGLAAAASGLVIAVTLKMAQPLLQGGRWPAPSIAVLALTLVGILGFPLGPVVLCLVPMSIAIAWIVER
jgi:chromate transporter